MSKIKYFFLTLFFLAIIDLASNNILKKYTDIELGYSSYCYDEYTLYGYCENSTHYSYLKEKNIKRKNTTYINQYKIAYDPSKEKINPSEAALIILGDSFIQADEIKINKRICSMFRDQMIKAIEIGYGSWNPYQYEKILEKYTFDQKSTFLVFLMINDFMPSYVHGYTNTVNSKDSFYRRAAKQKTFIEKFKFKFKNILKNNSLTVNILNKLRIKIKQNIYTKDLLKNKLIIAESQDESNYDDCSLIKSNLDKEFKDQFDYLVFSKNPDCWPKNYVKEVNETILSIKRFEKKLKKDQKAIFFLVPGGWVLKNENTEGKAKIFHDIKMDTSITQKGLGSYLKNNLENFYDLEPVFLEIKLKHKDKNSLYFASNGHWRIAAHKELYKWLNRKIEF